MAPAWPPAAPPIPPLIIMSGRRSFIDELELELVGGLARQALYAVIQELATVGARMVLPSTAARILSALVSSAPLVRTILLILCLLSQPSFPVFSSSIISIIIIAH